MNRTDAFLQAMGLGPVWVLRDAAPEAPAAPVVDAAPSDDIAAMDWPQLRAAVAACTRCSACRSGVKPLMGDGPDRAQWMVAAGATTAADEQARSPLAGDAGTLLANMLNAAGHAREETYVTNLIKCRPTSSSGGDRAPTAEEAAACRPYLERELALTGASTLITVGQIAANALLGKPLQEPLAGTRGTVHEVGGRRMVATLHPGELLRRGRDKALAWSDLCLAMAADAKRD